MKIETSSGKIEIHQHNNLYYVEVCHEAYEWESIFIYKDDAERYFVALAKILFLADSFNKKDISYLEEKHKDIFLNKGKNPLCDLSWGLLTEIKQEHEKIIESKNKYVRLTEKLKALIDKMENS